MKVKYNLQRIALIFSSTLAFLSSLALEVFLTVQYYYVGEIAFQDIVNPMLVITLITFIVMCLSTKIE